MTKRLSEIEINEILKKDPLIRELAIKSEEDKICVCGHKEKFHHNHKDFDWIPCNCRRCMMCDWDNGCFMFRESILLIK